MDLTSTTLTLPRGVARLTPMRPDHADALFAASEPVVWSYMTSPPPRNRTEMLAWMNVALEGHAKGTDLPWVIEHKPSDRVIGTTRYLDIQHQHRAVEIGFTWINPAHQRSSINTECKFLLLRHAFEALGCVRVQLKTDGRNLQSQNAIARLGAVREGVHRRHRVLYDGFIRDTVYFSITDLEWPSVKRGLIERLGPIAQGA
ncbi:MAG: GNAT family N-acetyltransferase [Phycisphaerales bacterium]